MTQPPRPCSRLSAWSASMRQSGSPSASPGAASDAGLGAAAGCSAPPPARRAVVVNYAVKVAIGRERPLIEDHPPLARAPSKLSFPSAHATSSFAAATAFGRVEPRTRLPLYALAAAHLRLAAPTSACTTRPTSSPAWRSAPSIGGFVPGVGERTLEERMADFVHERASRDQPVRRRRGEGRHRRAPQRGQVHPVQRAHPRRGRDWRLPLHHDRPQRRRRPGSGRAAGAGRRDGRARRRSYSRRSSSTTSPASSAARPRARASATGSSPRSARRTRSATSCAPTRRGGVPHPEGRIDPGDDIELIELELLAADLEQARRRLERVTKQARSLDKAVGRRARLARGGRRRARGRSARCARCRRPRRHRTPRACCTRSRRSRSSMWPTWTRARTRCPDAVASHAQGAGATAVASAPESSPSSPRSATRRRPASCAPSSGSRSRASTA